MNDIRRKQRSNSHDGSNDFTDRGTTEYHGRDASGDTGKGREADVLSGAGRTLSLIHILEVANQRIIRVVVKRLVDEDSSGEKSTDEKEKEE